MKGPILYTSSYVYLYQQGDTQALEKLLEKNKGIVNKSANKYYVERTSSIDREDLQQGGMIGLITAADRYDFDNPKKASFITYAVFWINQKINRFVHTRCTNEEISINTPTGEGGNQELMDYIEDVDYSFENVEEKLYHQQLRKELEEAMAANNSLKKREILKLHYSWDNNKEMTIEEIGEIYGISNERVRQLETNALRKLRQSKWGRLKAMEIYGQKKRFAACSIPGTIESISFAQRYLCDEVI